MTSGNFSKGLFLLLLLSLSFTTKAQLSAKFNALPQNGCTPLIVKFTDQSTGSPTSWKWDLGNGTISFLQNPSAIYFNPGKYTVKLVVQNQNSEDSVIKTDYIEVFQNPVVDFSVNTTTGCYPLIVQFKDASTTSNGSVISWLWDFGDGTTSTDRNPTHTFTSAKNFNITLQIKTSNGCISTLTKPGLIQISTGVLADFTNDNPNTCTAPVTINFQNQSTGTGAVQYLWDFGDNTSSNLPNPPHTYTTNGTYSVKLILINNSGCKDTSVKTNAVTIGSVKANLSVPDIICQNIPVQMNSTSAPVPASVLWDFGDGTTSTKLNPSKKYTSSGNFTVKIVANFGACTDSATKQITVLPKAVANFTADKRSSCSAPFTVNFSSQAPGAQSYLWSFGDGTTSALPNPSHTYNIYSSFTVKLIVSNGNGCTDTVQKLFHIIVQKPKATITNLPDSGCIPFTKSFNLTYSSPDPVSGYLWDFGDGNTSTLASPTHTYTAEAAYDVSVIITTLSGCKDTAKVIKGITTNTKPAANFGATPLNACAKTAINFSDQSGAGVTKWLWQFGDSTTSAQKNPSHSYVDTGFFDVQLKIWKGGCSDSIKFLKYVHINPPVAKFNVVNDCKKPFDKVFTDMSIGADQWQWDFGDGATSTIKSPVHIYSTAGTYTVTLKVINNTYGCDFTTTRTIYVINTKANFSSADTIMCKGSKTVFTNSIPLTQLGKLSWNFGDGSPSIDSNANTVSYTYKNSGSYTVKLIFTDINGCKDSSTKINYITINGPTAKFGTGGSSACLNSNLAFNDSSVSDGTHPIQKWVWDYGDGIKDSLNTSSFQHLYSQAGSYIVKCRF
jgi:PKD repeat protein